MHRPPLALARSLVLTALALGLPAAGQIPKEPALAEPIPPIQALASLLTSAQAKDVERLLATGEWQQAGQAAQALLQEDLSSREQEATAAAGALTLLALAKAGEGDSAGAICRWHAAQSFDPDFRSADLTPYGEAGRLLENHPLDDLAERPEGPPLRVTSKVSGEPAVTRPELVWQRSPEYSGRARKERVAGTVILEAVIGKDGTVSRARALKGLPFGLTAASVEAVCDWRFKPATREGAPVDVFYVLTVNFQVDSPPQMPKVKPPPAG